MMGMAISIEVQPQSISLCWSFAFVVPGMKGLLFQTWIVHHWAKERRETTGSSLLVFSETAFSLELNSRGRCNTCNVLLSDIDIIIIIILLFKKKVVSWKINTRMIVIERRNQQNKA
jgi:hypothetical protein